MKFLLFTGLLVWARDSVTLLMLGFSDMNNLDAQKGDSFGKFTIRLLE